MEWRRGLVGLGLAALIWSGLIPLAHAESYTLEEVFSRALGVDETVQIAQEGITVAQEEKRRARSGLLPKLTLNANYTRAPAEVNEAGFVIQPRESYGLEVDLQQPLYAGGKNWAGLRIAEQGIRVARAALDLSKEALLIRVARVYYEILKGQHNVTAQQRNVERLREHRRLAELRYKVGEVTEAVLLRAEAELAGAEAELATLSNALEVSKRELEQLAGLTALDEVQEPAEPAVPDGDLQGMLRLALERREDLRQDQLEVQIAADQVAFARGNFLPVLMLEGTYFNRDRKPAAPFLLQESYFVGARLEFPIFEGFLRAAELEQANRQLRQRRLEADRSKKQIEIEVTQAFLTLQAVTQVLGSRERQLEFARKNYEIVSRQFTFGLATNIDLLDANQTLIESERDVITARYDRHLAILDLQQRTGVLLDRVLERIGRPI